MSFWNIKDYSLKNIEPEEISDWLVDVRKGYCCIAIKKP